MGDREVVVEEGDLRKGLVEGERMWEGGSNIFLYLDVFDFGVSSPPNQRIEGLRKVLPPQTRIWRWR